MTATIARTSSVGRRPAPALPARLALAPKSPVAGLLDGAWWPRSRDLSDELRALTGALDGPWGRVTRITVNPAHWPVVPHKVPVAGHTVHVGWFTDEQDPHKLILLSYTRGRLDLLVIPPETDPAVAVHLMSAAATPGGLLTASRMMAGERSTRGAAEARYREETRDQEETLGQQEDWGQEETLGQQEDWGQEETRGQEEDWDTDGGAGPVTRRPAGPLGSVRSGPPARRR
ncbi:DUF5994 family protein [Streptomyces kanasensis]|uniref:DUF5994 family protein n=1 Tax=Streptomyces kanasensis TaxID=936756 RepID=UPI0036FB5DEA